MCCRIVFFISGKFLEPPTCSIPPIHHSLIKLRICKRLPFTTLSMRLAASRDCKHRSRNCNSCFEHAYIHCLCVCFWQTWPFRLPEAPMVSSPAKNLEFRGFDSSRLAILRGGIPRSIGDLPEVRSQRFLVYGFLACGLNVQGLLLPLAVSDSVSLCRLPLCLTSAAAAPRTRSTSRQQKSNKLHRQITQLKLTNAHK